MRKKVIRSLQIKYKHFCMVLWMKADLYEEVYPHESLSKGYRREKILEIKTANLNH